jgi:hypothetical protein
MANPVPLDDALLERYGHVALVAVARRSRRTRRHKDPQALQVWRDHRARRVCHVFCLRVIPTREAKTFRLMVEALTLRPQPFVLIKPGARRPRAVLFIGLETHTLSDDLRIFLQPYGVLVPEPIERSRRRALLAALDKQRVA